MVHICLDVGITETKKHAHNISAVQVLNMKPQEILGMLEEAAGTRMYETKKEAALRTLEKKQVKVQEIEKVLFPGPALAPHEAYTGFPVPALHPPPFCESHLQGSLPETLVLPQKDQLKELSLHHLYQMWCPVLFHSNIIIIGHLRSQTLVYAERAIAGMAAETPRAGEPTGPL